MLVFALVLLFFANNQPVSVLTQTYGAEAAQNGNMLATFALAFFMSIFILYGFDTAGTYGEETVDASKQAPRGVLLSVLALGRRRRGLPAGDHPVAQGHSGVDRDGPRGWVPDRVDHHEQPQRHAIGSVTFGDLYLFVILRRCSCARLRSTAPTSRMMFSMSRDRHLPLGRAWGHVNGTFRTPANAVITVGDPRRAADPPGRRRSAASRCRSRPPA